MYDELVRRLRNGLSCYGERCLSCPDKKHCTTKYQQEAVDAIEELSRRETPMKITEIHVDEYYCPACGAENNCDQGYVQDAYCPACGQRLLLEPPKEESTNG